MRPRACAAGRPVPKAELFSIAVPADRQRQAAKPPLTVRLCRILRRFLFMPDWEEGRRDRARQLRGAQSLNPMNLMRIIPTEEAFHFLL